MKHKFLLDENILHFAIKGINEENRVDETSTELLRLIARNCHRIVLNKFLIDCYWHQLNKVRGPRSGPWAQERISFINGFIHKAEKLSFESNEYAELPAGAVIPADDVEIVRIACATEARFITGDARLRAAIARCAEIHLQVLRPAEGVPFASEV